MVDWDQNGLSLSLSLSHLSISHLRTFRELLAGIFAPLLVSSHYEFLLHSANVSAPRYAANDRVASYARYQLIIN